MSTNKNSNWSFYQDQPDGKSNWISTYKNLILLNWTFYQHGLNSNSVDFKIQQNMSIVNVI